MIVSVGSGSFEPVSFINFLGILSKTLLISVIVNLLAAILAKLNEISFKGNKGTNIRLRLGLNQEIKDLFGPL